MINTTKLEDKKNSSLPCSVSRKTERQVRQHVQQTEHDSVSEYLRQLIETDLEGDR